MSVIEGASVSVKTMSDGTLRLSIDIEPRNAQAAFALFGAPGRAVALAALKDGSAAITSESASEVKEKQQREYLGDLCYRAVQWCNDLEFRRWLTARDGLPDLLTGDGAAAVIYAWCGITSRKQLDTNPVAAEKFNRLIRGPYQKHLQARGLV